MNVSELINISNQFKIAGSVFDVIPFGSGHINDTYLLTTNKEKYILQRINHHIFKDVEAMNNNIIRALKNLNDKQESACEFRFRSLEVILTLLEKNYQKDEYGNFWRMMNFVSGSISFDVANEPAIALEAASALGYFQRMMVDLNPEEFYPSIKDFHNLEMRINAFRKAVENDKFKRCELAKEEIDFVNNNIEASDQLSELLESKKVPLRVTHNDTKINNVLLDEKTLKGIAVIDLDTVMPGTVLFDFGDMMRTYLSPAAEDEEDLSKVKLRLPIFEAMAKGYISELKDVLTESELDNLVFGGKVMTYMQGVRFLTDYLEGDHYYKTSRKNHNLDRCRTQFRLFLEIQESEYELNNIVAEILNR